MVNCGICGAEVPKQPTVTADGRCSICQAKLKPA